MKNIKKINFLLLAILIVAIFNSCTNTRGQNLGYSIIECYKNEKYGFYIFIDRAIGFNRYAFDHIDSLGDYYLLDEGVYYEKEGYLYLTSKDTGFQKINSIEERRHNEDSTYIVFKEMGDTNPLLYVSNIKLNDTIDVVTNEESQIIMPKTFLSKISIDFLLFVYYPRNPKYNYYEFEINIPYKYFSFETTPLKRINKKVLELRVSDFQSALDIFDSNEILHFKYLYRKKEPRLPPTLL